MAKTKVDDINRNIYDIKNKDDYEFKMKKGLNREIVEEISKMKNEPEWMREIRLKALEAYNILEMPTWGPDLSELKMDEIATYVKPKTKLNSNWEDVPEDIRDTFELDDDNKPKLVKKGSKDYSKLFEKLEPVLEDYTLTDSDNNEIKVGEKRIYAPSIVSVIDGKAKELTTGISDKQTDGYMKLTKEMEKETYNKIKKVLKQVSDKSNTCYLDKGC